MKKSSQATDGDVAERSEHARKIFRYVSEVARRIDEASGACKTTSGLFDTALEVNRQKLRDNCEKLMFADPILYGYKAQELLWRKGYYEVVSAAKQFSAKEQSSTLLMAHIEAGIGHYQQIIYKMQMEASLNMRQRLDYPILDAESDRESTDDVNEWARKSIHSCLVYLGDLCRYKADLESEWDPSHAERFYLQATCLDCENGAPYNQLGTLYIGKNYNLDSVCYYMHSLACSKPFDGVEDNLIALLDKNNKTLEDHTTGADITPLKLFVLRFLSLLDQWYFQKDADAISEFSNLTLFTLKECLNCSDETEPLNSKMILNVASICLLAMSKTTDQAFPIKAFTLGLYSQLLEKLLSQLQVIGFDVPVINRSNGYVKPKNGVTDSTAKKLRLRRRAAESSASSESELELDDSDKDLSLDESASSSDDISSDNENAVKTPVKTLDAAKLSLFIIDNILPSMSILQDWLKSEPELIKSCGKSGHALFKLLVDILNIISVNFLSVQSPAIEKQSHEILNKFHSSDPCADYKTFALPEDLKLKHIEVLKTHHSTLKWDGLQRIKTTETQETAIRMKKLVDFGHFITVLIHGVCFNTAQQYFYVKYKFLNKKNNLKSGFKKGHEKKEAKRHSQKAHSKTHHNRVHHTPAHGKNSSDTNQMRILGKLWLMNQVKELETQVKSGKKSHNFPPYVVIDTDALCLHANIVKQLVGARKFIVLVPSVVLQAIDELKKESSGVRDTIRWLESQLRSGSRFLRAQRPREIAPVTSMKYPKKMTRDMQNFVQIMEFCNHFVMTDTSAAARGGDEGGGKAENGHCKAGNIIALLTGSEQYLNALDRNKDFSYIGLAQTAGVALEHIRDFSNKWKHVFNKTGKKR